MATLGIDIGGSGVKGAPVDTARGELLAERIRVPTPQPSDVTSVVEAVAEVAGQFDDFDRVGITFPGVVVDGVTRTAANVDKSWLDVDADALFTKAVGGDVEVHVVNDADAAGLAEVTYGAGKGVKGVVLLLTFGTGIGSGLFLDGKLVPNTELGHIEIDGHDAEKRAASSAKEREDLSYEEWAGRLTTYYRKLERLFSPELFVVGGGVSKKADKFLPLVDIETEILPAQLRNAAGIVGAALYASEATD